MQHNLLLVGDIIQTTLTPAPIVDKYACKYNWEDVSFTHSKRIARAYQPVQSLKTCIPIPVQHVWGRRIQSTPTTRDKERPKLDKLENEASVIVARTFSCAPRDGVVVASCGEKNHHREGEPNCEPLVTKIDCPGAKHENTCGCPIQLGIGTCRS